MSEAKLNRRQFLKTSAALGAGLVIGFQLSGCDQQPHIDANGQLIPNAWLKISTKNVITLIVDKSEMGQGVTTALPTLIAEELEVSLDKIVVEFAPAARIYSNRLFMIQATGGSTSVSSSWQHLRKVGASARQLLISAAAKNWRVDETQCRAEDGFVYHGLSNKRVPYGDLAATASRLPKPSVTLKSKQDFKLIGRPLPRIDNFEKVTGQGLFGIDVDIPNTLIAVVVRCPTFGGKVERYDASKTLKLMGIISVLKISSGIAIIGDTYWQCRQGAEALEVSWDLGKLKNLSSESISKDYAQRSKEEGRTVENRGNVDNFLNNNDNFSNNNDNSIESIYEVPFLAHATMEPQNATVQVRDDGVDVWAPTQGQSNVQEAVSELSGFKHHQIKVHTTLLGGGFGRRICTDFVEEATEISLQLKRTIQVVWSREDDIQHDWYRPASYNVLRAKLDLHGQPQAWHHKIVGPSIVSQIGADFVRPVLPYWIPHTIRGLLGQPVPAILNIITDPTVVEGAEHTGYQIDNFKLEYVAHDPGIPLGFWRSVGSSQNGFIVESFIDELAHKAKTDPYEYRRALLSDEPRRQRVLDQVARQANWHTAPPAGVYRGIAQVYSFFTYVAQVVELSVSEQGQITLHKVYCVVDCGTVINPDIVKAQMEGAIIFGLTATLKGTITIENGAVQQSNFHDYELLRINECPDIEVHIIDSDEDPTGVGEPGVPPIAPAVCNAVYAATQHRVRKLPIKLPATRPNKPSTNQG